ncbi:MAG TPA: serine hydrolase domain-containing protein [Pirellulales bacterium]|jgi:CubicO group peptidase (beta-lactamase class C family)|nr:serine hydrolase domain-containing protein [Pirellulales bacterium]
MNSNPDLPLTRGLIERGMADGMHTGAQVYTTLAGRPAGELAVGEARPGVPISDDTLMLWLSSSKPVAAVAMLQLVERGRCTLDDPVCSHLPEFAQHGKERVTIEHLLVHTAGFRWVDWGDVGTPWPTIIDRICSAKLERDWLPGAKAGYHPLTTWYVLGELVRRIDGRNYSDYVRAEIFEPLGMDNCWIGMPRERFLDYGDRIAPMPNTERPDLGVSRWSSETGVLACVPGANGHGPTRALVRLYEMLLGSGTRDGVRILSPRSVQRMTSRCRHGMFDETFKCVIDWGLGLLISTPQDGPPAPYGYGPGAAPDTYGHSGSQSSVAFADPERQLAAAIVFNGMPGELRHQRRVRTVLEALYQDLRLA